METLSSDFVRLMVEEKGLSSSLPADCKMQRLMIAVQQLWGCIEQDVNCAAQVHRPSLVSFDWQDHASLKFHVSCWSNAGELFGWPCPSPAPSVL